MHTAYLETLMDHRFASELSQSVGKNRSPKSEIFSMDTVDILGHIILCCVGLPSALWNLNVKHR